MKRSKFTDSQIIEDIKRVEAGLGVPDICRELGISAATFYKWRSKFSGMDVLMMARMKELEAENARLRKMYIEKSSRQTSSRRLLKKLVKSSRRSEMPKRVVQERSVSIKLACHASKVSEACDDPLKTCSVDNPERKSK